MGHARALLSLERAAQITAANQIAAKKLSVREAESLVKKLGAEFNLTSPKPKKEKSRDMRRVEEELSDLLTAQVEVRVKKRVKRNGRSEELGEVAIQFGSLDELNGLIDRLRGYTGTLKRAAFSNRKDLARVHDVLRVERALDGAHHVDRAGAGLGHQEVHLVQADAVLAGAGALQRQRARSPAAWLSFSAISRSSGMLGSIR